MAHIKPFCAVRPNHSIAMEFCSKTVALYKKNELETTLKNKPNSFLQIIKSNIKSPKKTASKERYTKVKKQYHKFKNEGLLIKDDQEGFYILEININHQTFTGIIAAASVEDYKKGHIRKHEDTIESKETIFKNYLKTTRFNTEPVLLTYKNQTSISDVVHNIKKQPATVSLEITDQESQKLWYVTDKKEIEIIREGFKNIDALYIADGHHRSASSALLSEDEPNAKEAQFFMAFLIPEDDLIIQEYNRVVTDLNGISVGDFLKKIEVNFSITPLKSFESSKKFNGFCMYLEGQFYSLSLLKGFEKPNSPLHELDAYILQEKILKPILGIKNVRTDERLAYTHKSDQMQWIKKHIDNGTYAVGFGLNPVQIHELKAIGDNNLIMPPKSTYIYPKLRSGMAIYEF